MENSKNGVAPLKSRNINIITLGCSKNTVDSEHLLGHLALAGFNVLHDGDAVVRGTYNRC